ncbi:MAG: hypothetical protein H6Q90_3538 [Deltaproteobacteria bacterium]|nr:hypothetical protein [Deltaproteobacteria bacterium]
MPTKYLLALFSLTIAGCASDPDRPVPTPPQTAEEAGRTAAASAADTAQLLADVNEFVGAGFGGLPVAGGPPPFAPPANCTASFSIDQTHIQLESDCTLPSGRHTRGSMSVALGGSCGFGGFTVDFDLLVESQPGAGDEVAVTGHVALKHGAGELWLASQIEHESHLGGHDVNSKVAGCFMLDLPEKRAAFDGVVSVDVDGQRISLFRVSDLQHMLCEWLPFTGSVHVEHLGEFVEVVFDRDTPTTGVVTIVTPTSSTRVQLPVPTGGFCSSGAIPTPSVIDYQVCGGCGNPVPPGGPSDPVPEPIL